MSSVDQINALAAGELDAAFVYRQDNIVEDSIAIHPLRYDNVVLAASIDLLFDHEGPLSLEDIDGLPVVAFPGAVAAAYHDRLFDALRGIGFEANIVQEGSDETTRLSLVSAGVGCAFVNSANMQRPPWQVQFRQVAGLSVPIVFLFLTRLTPGNLTQLLTDTVTQIDA